MHLFIFYFFQMDTNSTDPNAEDKDARTRQWILI